MEFKDLDNLRDDFPEGPILPRLQFPMLDHLFSVNDVPRTGVIHLGAHVGQEIILYSWLGFTRAVMVEPQPQEFAVLGERCAAMTRFTQAAHHFLGEDSRPGIEFQCVPCAVSDEPGTATFHRTRDSQLSSLGRPEGELAGEERYEAEEIEVPLRTLDEVIASLDDGWKAEDFTYLRMNIQGSELKALMGAEHVLKSLRAIFLEVSLVQRYEGQPMKEDFERFLEPRGFECAFAVRRNDVGNLFYRRRT